MHVLLLQNQLYIPAHGGASVSNRSVMEAIARRGHTCDVVAPAFGAKTTLDSEGAFRDALHKHVPEARRTEDGTYTFTVNRVTVHAVVPTNRRNLMSGLHDTLQRVSRTESNPEEDATPWVLVSLDDAASALLETAHRVAPGRVVSLAHTSTSLPFGPMSRVKDPGGTDLIRRSASVLANTAYMRDYLATWGRVDATVAAIAPFDPGPHPNFASFDDGYITLINPCDLKGISIFLALADRFPEAPFAAVPTWGTTDADRTALEHRSNVTLLNPVDDIDEIYAQTRILLMPSLWIETLGRCATEALQRGLPVLASNHGGLPEAMGGEDYLLPITPIPSMSNRINDRSHPVPDEVPAQDVEPWATALQRLLTDRDHYHDLSKRSRNAGNIVAQSKPRSDVAVTLEALSPTAEAGSEGGGASKSSRKLSDDQRRLLAMRALKKTSGSKSNP